jgi:hypothetical protein
MNCEEIAERALAFVDGQMAAEAREPYEAHLEGCAPCARRVRFEAGFNRLLRERLAPAEPPRRLVARVRRRLARHALAGYAVAAALAAVLALPPLLGHPAGIAGWRALLDPSSGSLVGVLVCVECERAQRPPADQRRCRGAHHHTGVRSDDGSLWTIADEHAGAVRTIDVRGYDLL